MQNIFNSIRQTLSENADPAIQLSTQRFFKQTTKSYGIKTDVVRKISKTYFSQIAEMPSAKIFALCELLWRDGYMEEITVACYFSEKIHKQYQRSDFEHFERWITLYVDNWASCDTLCNHTVGEFVEMYPEYIAELKRFAHSDNLWLRRAAAVSLIIPARRGKFLDDILEIAETLLLDSQDMVQKGYGWMLKAASMSETFVKNSEETKQRHTKAVFDFVMRNKKVMPRTALRYAIEKMPDDLRRQAMEK